MMVGLTQVWNPAAEAKPLEVHPFRIYLDDLKLGDTLFTGSRTITLEDIEHFAHFTGDTFYAHMDEEAAAASPIFLQYTAPLYLLVVILAFACLVLFTFSALKVFMPSVCSSPSSTYSWFIASRPDVEPSCAK